MSDDRAFPPRSAACLPLSVHLARCLWRCLSLMVLCEGHKGVFLCFLSLLSLGPPPPPCVLSPVRLHLLHAGHLCLFPPRVSLALPPGSSSFPLPIYLSLFLSSPLCIHLSLPVFPSLYSARVSLSLPLSLPLPLSALPPPSPSPSLPSPTTTTCRTLVQAAVGPGPSPRPPWPGGRPGSAGGARPGSAPPGPAPGRAPPRHDH